MSAPSPSRTFSIAAIPADGVGAEVVAAGRAVLDALADASGGRIVFRWTEFPWGCGYYDKTGRMMDEDGLEALRDFDAIYFGAVGWPTVPDHISLWGLRLRICQNFDQWANVRPVHFHPGVVSPLRKADTTELDWVVVRENSEGEYAGLGGRNLSGRGPGNEVALQTALFTEAGCERIIRFAFDLARTRSRHKVSSVTKSNAQQYDMVLWDETFARVAKDYPDVETESVLVDAMAAKFVLRPEDLSVVVASNLNADILSDLGSALAGSLGLAASANLNPERRFPSMFEPVHGSAPDIAGRGLANPIGALGSAALMLEHFGLPDEAARIGKAIEATTGAGVLTRDVGGAATTEQVTAAVIGNLGLSFCEPPQAAHRAAGLAVTRVPSIPDGNSEVSMRKILSTVAVAVCAASAIVVSNTPALADGGFRYLALRALANTHSVYVTGRGWTNWASGSGSTGQIGSTNSPRGIDACYQHSNPRWQDATNLTVVALIS